MYSPKYHPELYYPRLYYPAVAVRPLYYPHGYFPVLFYPDLYFPGTLLSVVPPPEPPVVQIGGGRPVPQRFIVPDVVGVLDLRLPVPQLHAFGFVTPADIQVRLELQLPSPQLSATGQAQAAGIVATWTLTLPGLEFRAEGSASQVRKRSTTKRNRADEDAEEQLLLEHYLLSLKDE